MNPDTSAYVPKDLPDLETVSGVTRVETKVKGSRFIGIIANCPDEDSIQSIIDRIRTELPNATHYCYAAVYGGISKMERFSDNGEPSGTAGRPIMDVLRYSGLTDTIIVVVRYFGGTLLGTGGLVQAYSSSASDALNASRRTTCVGCFSYAFRIQYHELGAFEKTVRSLSVGDIEMDYGTDISVKVNVRIRDKERFESFVRDLTSGRVTIVPVSEGYVSLDRSRSIHCI